MPDIYEWLFESYTLPKLRDMERDYDDTVFAFSDRAGLSKKERLRLHDLVSNMRLEWGVEVFAIGVRLGLRLSRPRNRSRPAGWLLDFLPQLDDPVP